MLESWWGGWVAFILNSYLRNSYSFTYQLIRLLIYVHLVVYFSFESKFRVRLPDQFAETPGKRLGVILRFNSKKTEPWRALRFYHIVLDEYYHILNCVSYNIIRAYLGSCQLMHIRGEGSPACFIIYRRENFTESLRKSPNSKTKKNLVSFHCCVSWKIAWFTQSKPQLRSSASQHALPFINSSALEMKLLVAFTGEIQNIN